VAQSSQFPSPEDYLIVNNQYACANCLGTATQDRIFNAAQNACILCSEGITDCASCSSDGKCLACLNEGQLASPYGDSCITTNFPDECVSHKAFGNDWRCDSCDLGFYLTSDFDCAPCGSNFASCTECDINQCFECDHGYFPDYSKQNCVPTIANCQDQPI
jgi:hypothetical protein